jgi:hypothetical protein
MQISYLYSPHLEWVCNHPEDALNYLTHDGLQGEKLYQNECYQEAIPYLNGAFDIALLLCRVHQQNNFLMVCKVVELARQLCHANRLTKNEDLNVLILVRAISLFSIEEPQWALSLGPAVLERTLHTKLESMLRPLIRNAIFPDDPVLINHYFQVKQNIASHCISVAQQRKEYYQMATLLIDTFCDTYLPEHWRRVCLDNLYRPVMHLQKLADTPVEQKIVYKLQRRANVLAQYLLE